MMTAVRERLLKLVDEKAVVRGEVTLASGRTSNFYIDGKRVTLDPEGSDLLAGVLVELCRLHGATAIGGPMIGADPIAGAVAAKSHQADYPVKGFIVRGREKQHGMQKRIEGPPLSDEDRVVLVDDVITTGGSVLKTIEAIRETGAVIVCCTCLVDREQGGREALEEAGIPYEPVFRRSELDLPS